MFAYFCLLAFVSAFEAVKLVTFLIQIEFLISFSFLYCVRLRPVYLKTDVNCFFSMF